MEVKNKGYQGYNFGGRRRIAGAVSLCCPPSLDYVEAKPEPHVHHFYDTSNKGKGPVEHVLSHVTSVRMGCDSKGSRKNIVPFFSKMRRNNSEWEDIDCIFRISNFYGIYGNIPIKKNSQVANSRLGIVYHLEVKKSLNPAVIFVKPLVINGIYVFLELKIASLLFVYIVYLC